MDAPAPLELRGIVKYWKDLLVLDEVDLTLEAGQMVWLGGRNGVGKTTLLRIAASLLLPGSGTVRLDGFDPARQRREFQSRLGYLPAGSASLFARLSVTRNLDFWGGMALLPKAARRARIAAAVQRFELSELQDRRVDRLSMGQRQRVRLASTFLHEPRVVLLDEPYNSLDDEGIELLTQNLRDVVARGGAVLWCSPSKVGSELPRDVGYLLDGGKLERL